MESFRPSIWPTPAENAANNKDDSSRPFRKGTKEETNTTDNGADPTRPPKLNFQANLPNLSGSSGLNRAEGDYRSSPISPKSARRFSWPRPGGRAPGLGLFKDLPKARESKEGWESIDLEQTEQQTLDDPILQKEYSLFRSGRTESRESLGTAVRRRVDSSEFRRSSLPTLTSSIWGFPNKQAFKFDSESDGSKGKLRLAKLRQDVKRLIGAQAEYYSFDAIPEHEAPAEMLDVLKYEGCALCLRRDFPTQPKEGSTDRDDPAFVVLTCKLFNCRHVAHMSCLHNAAGSTDGTPVPALLNFHGTNAFRVVVLPPKTPPIPFPLPRDVPGNLRYCALELEINHIISNVQVLQISWGHTISTLVNARRREYLLITLSPSSQTPAPQTPAGIDSEPNTPSATPAALSASQPSIVTGNGGSSSSSSSSSGSATVAGSRKSAPGEGELTGDALLRNPGAFPSFAIGRGQMTFKCTDQTSMHSWIHALIYDLSALHDLDHEREKRNTCKLVAVDAVSRNVLTIGIRRVEEQGDESLYSISYLKYEFPDVTTATSSVPPLSRGPGLNSPPLSPQPVEASPASANARSVFLPSPTPSPMTMAATATIPPSPQVFSHMEPPSPTPAWYTPPQSPGLLSSSSWMRTHQHDPTQPGSYSNAVMGSLPEHGIPIMTVPTMLEPMQTLQPLQPPRPIQVHPHIRNPIPGGYQDNRGPGDRRFMPRPPAVGVQYNQPYPRPDEDWSPGYVNGGVMPMGGMGMGGMGSMGSMGGMGNNMSSMGSMSGGGPPPRTDPRENKNMREFHPTRGRSRERGNSNKGGTLGRRPRSREARGGGGNGGGAQSQQQDFQSFRGNTGGEGDRAERNDRGANSTGPRGDDKRAVSGANNAGGVGAGSAGGNGEDRDEIKRRSGTPAVSKVPLGGTASASSAANGGGGNSGSGGNVGDASGPTSANHSRDRTPSVSPRRSRADSSGSNSPVFSGQSGSGPPSFFLNLTPAAMSQQLNLPTLGAPFSAMDFPSAGGDMRGGGNGNGGGAPSASSPPPAPPAINLTREQVLGNVVRLAKSHSGSRFLQQKLEEGDRDFFAVFYDEMKDHVPELMVDNFGHFAIEKLIVQANEEQTLTLLQKLAPHIVQVACQKHGSFSVQALVDSIRTPAQIYVLVEALTKDIVKVITHVSGHFVVLRLLQRFPYDFTKFIDDAITANCLQIGTDHHGLRVVKAVLALRRPSELTRLFKTIAKLTMKLVENQFGNYVIQSLLDVAPPNVRTNVKVKMEGKYMRLSQQKFSSNVVEKCLKQSSAHWRGIIIKELMQQPQVSDLLRDRYGNYVLQTALSVASPQQVQEISEAINQHLPSLRENVRGKWKKMLKKAAQRVV